MRKKYVCFLVVFTILMVNTSSMSNAKSPMKLAGSTNNLDDKKPLDQLDSNISKLEKSMLKLNQNLNNKYKQLNDYEITN